MENIEPVGGYVRVRPSGSKGEVYSDASMASLLAMHVANINAGKVLIWQRYNVMLAANALVLGMVANRVPTSPFHQLVWMFFGVTLCVAWLVVSVAAWRHNMRYLDAARRFSWKDAEDIVDEALNPINVTAIPILKHDWKRKGWYRDGIFVGAYLVIFLAMLGHLALFVGRL